MVSTSDYEYSGSSSILDEGSRRTPHPTVHPPKREETAETLMSQWPCVFNFHHRLKGLCDKRLASTATRSYSV